MSSSLKSSQVAFLKSEGYLVLDRRLPPEWAQRLRERLLAFAVRWPGRKQLLPDEVFVEFILSKEVLPLARAVLGEKCLVHHANGRVAASNSCAKVWHHDRDGRVLPYADRAAMYHFMFYPGGLDGGVAPLVLKARTHLLEVPRNVPAVLGTSISTDDVVLTGSPGLVIILDSAVWHMRPAASSAVPRFDLNVSFVEGPGDWPERQALAPVLSEVARGLGRSSARYFGDGRSE